MLFTQEDVIYTYTRQQAIADGEQVLVDCELSKEAGFSYPVYLTRSVWQLVQMAVTNKKYCNDTEGVLWDILWMSKLAIKRHALANKPLTDTIGFTVIVTGAGQKRNHYMFIQVGATDFDNSAPAITIMFPEDR